MELKRLNKTTVVIVLFVLFSYITTTAQCLSGIYTVGGTSPVFKTLQAAVDSLEKNGMCGNVTLNMRPGDYEEAITFHPITGLNSSASLTIQSETGNNASVKLFSSTFLNTIKLNGISDISIKKITIGGSNVKASVLFLEGGSKNIEISNCILNGSSQTVIATDLPVGATPPSHIRILNNTFVSDSYNILISTASSTNPKYNDIKINNNIFNATNKGYVDISLTDSLEFSGNTINAETAVMDQSILTLRSVTKSVIKKNKIISNNQSALTLYGCQKNIIANNMFVTAGLIGDLAATVKISDGEFIFINNSINCMKSTKEGSAFLTVGTIPSTSQFYNNIVTNQGEGFLIVNGFYLFTTGNNAYYHKGEKFGRVSTTIYKTFLDWMKRSFKETGAIYCNPFFKSDTDLHANEIMLRKAGTSVASYISDDFDGEPRNSNTPDIGADEFGIPGFDAVLSKFTFSATLCGGTTPIKVYLKNNGLTTLAATAISYRINNAPDQTFNWKGTIPTSYESLVELGSFNFLPNTPYTITAWLTVPNNQDLYKRNDTLTVTFPSIALSGTYTIGGTNPNFPTIQSAITALSIQGVCGPVTFNIRNGEYTEKLFIPTIKGTSLTSRITFQSEANDNSAVTLITTDTNYVATIENDKYLTFNKLGFKSTSTVSSNLLLYTDKIANCEIKGCAFKASTNNGNLIYLDEGGDSTLIENNFFQGGNNGIFNPSYSVFLRVINNSFEGQQSIGIRLFGDNIEVSKNTFNYINTLRAIEIDSRMGGKVRKNKIRFSGAADCGIYCSVTSETGIEIENNFISMTGGDGIRIFSYKAGTSGAATVYHNSIYQQGNGTCLLATRVNNITCKNNIYYKSFNQNYCLTLSDLPGFVSNYNCIKSSDSIVINADNTDYTLDSYKTISGNEANSVAVDSIFNSFEDLHLKTTQLKSKAQYITTVTDDIDGQTRHTQPDIGADETFPVVANSWPGDTDNDKKVDQYDLLPIGLYYNQKGNKRDSISNAWVAQSSLDWGIGQQNGADLKHVDCNGDGVINNDDTLAVNLNFNLIHAFIPITPILNYIPTNAPLYFQTSQISYKPGEWVVADVYIGNASSPVSNLYGIGFSISYDATVIVPGTEELIFTSSWLGTPGTNSIKFSKPNAATQTIHNAITRIDHTNANGFGKIASFKFQLKNDLIADKSLLLTFSDYKANDALNNPLTFEQLPLKLDITTGINEFENTFKFSIYPVPYYGSTNISYELSHKSKVSLEVYNALGEHVEHIVSDTQGVGTYRYSFSAKAKGYGAGIYFVKISIDNNVATKRIIEMD